MIVRLSVVIGMRVVVASVIRLPVVGVIVHVTVMAMFVFMHVLVKMIMGVDMVVFVGVGFFPVGVFVGMLVSVLMPMNVLVFMFPLHNAPPFNIKFNPYIVYMITISNLAVNSGNH
jgi:hypothetical protein